MARRRPLPARPTSTSRDLVLTALDSPAMAQRLYEQQPDTSGLDAEVRAGEARLEELAAAWAVGEISRKEWMVARAVIEQSVTRARAQVVRRDSRAPLRAFIGTYDEMLDRWQRFNVSQQRAVISSVLRSIMVMPADRTRNGTLTVFNNLSGSYKCLYD